MALQGKVKSFSWEKGYGFIECPQAGTNKDIFFLKSSVGCFVANKDDQVSFTLTDSEKGPTATDIQVMSDHPTYLGEVKSFNFEKGWGMIACEVIQQKYGRDMFFLRSECQDGYQAQPD